MTSRSRQAAYSTFLVISFHPVMQNLSKYLINYPPFAAGIFLAAPMAAIMSTINAQLLQSSATIIKDLYLNLRPDQMQNETRLKRMSAVITLVLGALLLLAAWIAPTCRQ